MNDYERLVAGLELLIQNAEGTYDTSVDDDIAAKIDDGIDEFKTALAMAKERV